MVENCMRGYNSSMFAYGQTGSGKTHTMLGDIDDLADRPSHQRGMTPRIFEYLFARIQQVSMHDFLRLRRVIHLLWITTVGNGCWIYTTLALQEVQLREQEQLSFVCKCSFLEIYNEHITDLLDPSSTNLQVQLVHMIFRFACIKSTLPFYGNGLIVFHIFWPTDSRRCEDWSLRGELKGGWSQKCSWCSSATNPSEWSLPDSLISCCNSHRSAA